MCSDNVIDVVAHLVQAIRAVAPEEARWHLTILEETPSICKIKLSILYPSVDEETEGEGSLDIRGDKPWQNEREVRVCHYGVLDALEAYLGCSALVEFPPTKTVAG
jgi:hypothetical protein